MGRSAAIFNNGYFCCDFGVFAKFPSDGVPYPIFAYTAILLWFCFSQAATNAAQSLVADASLLKKFYFRDC